MSRAIEIIDPEGERRLRIRRRMVILAVLVSLCLFGYPEAREFYPKWRALQAGREFAQYLSKLKAKAILNKTPMEVRLRLPDEVEVYQVTSCGPFAEKTRVETLKLSDFVPGVQFAAEPWVRDAVGTREPYLPRFCYDPLFGSSVFADGLAHGAIFLAHQTDLGAKRGEHVVQIQIEGPAGDLSIE